MAEKKQKCPICGTKLKMIDGRMTCKECGYYIREQDSQNSAPVKQNNNNNKSNNSSNPKALPYNIILAVSLPIGITAIVAIIFIITFVAAFTTPIHSNSTSQSYSHTSARPASLDEQTSESGAAEDSHPADAITSSFFQEMVKDIFHKPLLLVTDEDLASITSLQINLRDKTVYYQIDHSRSSYLALEDTTSAELSDLSCFPNLEYLSLEGRYLTEGDLDGLENLHSVYSQNNLYELSLIIPNPKNIYELGVEDNAFEETLDGIEVFTNLQYLSVEYKGLESISALEQFPNLHGLTLINCYSLTDYTPLMSLTGLEELVIRSGQMRNIDFLQAMPNLKLLAIEGSPIDSLEPLSSCQNLTVLYLEGNYHLKDFSPVSELTRLTDLTLNKGSSDAPFPSLENLTQLQSLSLRNGYIRNLDVLAALPNLTYLSLESCTFAEESLEPLTEIPLVYLNLSGSHVYENAEDIFGIPTLQSLILDRFRAVVDFTDIPDNKTLRLLSMNDFEIATETYSYEYVNLSEHYDLFDHFPNLEELYVESMGIDSLDFVEKLPSLECLDITDNSVASLKPLESLSNFHTVWCGKNPISESVSKNSNIAVYTNSTPN